MSHGEEIAELLSDHGEAQQSEYQRQVADEERVRRVSCDILSKFFAALVEGRAVAR